MKIAKSSSLFISLLICFILQLQTLKVFSQAHRIEIDMKGTAGIKAQLCYYQGDKQYLVQNSIFDKKNKLVFEGKESLPTGVYLIIMENIGYFDLLIKNEPEFSISADKSDIIKTISVKGSEENKVFFQYQKQVSEIKKQIADIDTLLSKKKNDNDSKGILVNQKSELEQKLLNLATTIKANKPKTYLAKILASMELSNPDEMDFSDPDLLRTPFYHNMIRLFIKKNIEKNPDFIISETSKFLEKIEKTKANYQYVLGYLINFYNTFYKNGINQVFVSLADNYFLPNKATWLSGDALKQLQERRDFLAQGLPGMQASDLTLESNTGEYVSLLQLNSKLTLLYFWSSNCGHCNISTQVLKDKYEKLTAKGIQIFAVNIDNDKAAWLKKIEESELPWINCYDPNEISKYRDKYYVYGSPLMFVIGQNKKILAIKNGETEIEEFVNEIVRK